MRTKELTEQLRVRLRGGGQQPGGSRRDHEVGGGWSRPPRLPGASRWHRSADRFLSGVQSICKMGLLAVVLGAFFVASLLPDRIGVWIAVVLYLAVGLYCSVNFWRCREAHCVITGAGFTLLGLGLLAEALGVHTPIGEYNGQILLGVLVVALAFEAVVRARNGTNAVGGSRTRGRDNGC
jgi:hypothetical protein